MSNDKQEQIFFSLVWLARIIVCLLTIGLALAIDSTATERHRADIRAKWQEQVDDLSLQLRASILQNTQTVWGLAANVSVQPDINETQFKRLASVIFKLAPELLNIGLAPDFVIKHIYPLQGNQAALGLDLQGNESVIWIIVEVISQRKEAERLKSEFISTVSHELRTPLTSISGALSLLTTNAVGELSGKAQQLLKIAQRNSDQLGFLINDLLDIEKLIAGKMDFNVVEFPVSEAITESLENIQNYATEKNITLNAQELSTTTVKADKQRLAQALNNILSNAIKFSPVNGQIRIWTKLHGQGLRIYVQDEGPGIAPEFRERMFQKFSQADSSDRRSKGGTGLGLAITKELMARMEGDVDFTSEAGQGATFWLEVPAA